jgi:hypothetical protein
MQSFIKINKDEAIFAAVRKKKKKIGIFGELTFLLYDQSIPKTKCYTCLGIIFSNGLDLRLQKITNSTTK